MGEGSSYWGGYDLAVRHFCPGMTPKLIDALTQVTKLKMGSSSSGEWAGWAGIPQNVNCRGGVPSFNPTPAKGCPVYPPSAFTKLRDAQSVPPFSLTWAKGYLPPAPPQLNDAHRLPTTAAVSNQPQIKFCKQLNHAPCRVFGTRRNPIVRLVIPSGRQICFAKAFVRRSEVVDALSGVGRVRSLGRGENGLILSVCKKFSFKIWLFEGLMWQILYQPAANGWRAYVR